MRDKNPKGFIQIPLLIVIIAGVLVLSGGGYFGVKKYKNYLTEKNEKTKQAQEYQKALEETQKEIEKLRQENQFIQEKQKQLQSSSKPSFDTIISSS